MRSSSWVPVSLLTLLLAGCEGEAEAAAVEADQLALQPRAQVEPAEALGPATLEPVEPTVKTGSETRFLGAPEAQIRETLRTGAIAKVERGRGGRSLGFRIELSDGTRGYFKPEQDFSAAHWFSEVAAYYVDRALGFGRVPPLVGRRFAFSDLRAAAGDDRRVRELQIGADGSLRGAFILWVEGGLEPLALPREWERWVRVRAGVGITPYQRPADHQRSLREGPLTSLEAFDPARPLAEPEPVPRSRAGELSDLIVFDHLIQNLDRWGGAFTNVRTKGHGGPLVFLDNGAGFWPNPSLPLMNARLKHLERFRPSTVEALRRFDRAALEAAMAEDELAPLLTPALLDGLEARVGELLAHFEAMHALYGDAVFLADAPP